MAIQTKVELCNRALLGLGANAITSFEDGTTESDVCRLFYDPALDDLLTAHPWTFARTEAALDKLAEAPAAEWTYGYTLPADFLLARYALTAAGDEIALDGYEVGENWLATDVDGVVLVYTYKAPESRFHPPFQTALVSALKAQLVGPITQDPGQLPGLVQLAARDAGRARFFDSQQDPPKAIRSFPLVSARY